MARFEDLQPNAAVRGVLSDCLVTVVRVEWFGEAVIGLDYKTLDGQPGNILLYRDDEARLEIAELGRPWSFDGDGDLFRLVSEAHRIRLAHLFDRLLAVHTSLVEPLPHQITAVYESMLPRQPLRFLLADDFILAIVEFTNDVGHKLHYVRQPFRREPDFGVTSVNYDFAELFARAEAPR